MGVRETQALFYCPSCNSWTNADLQASLSIGEKGHPHLYPSAEVPPIGGRDSRRKMLDDAMDAFWESVVSMEASRTSMPVKSGI